MQQLNRGQHCLVGFSKDKGDQSASRLVCCSASWQLWRGTAILESPVHFWGFWQKGSSVELSLLSWSVTSYRQTLVPDGFCSCTRLRQTDVMPVRAEVVLPCKPSYQNSECRKEIYIDMYFKEAREQNTSILKLWLQKQIVVAIIMLTEAKRSLMKPPPPPNPLLSPACQFFCDHFGQNASFQKAFSKITVYFAKVALQSQ